MQTLYVEYDYRHDEETSLSDILHAFESELGGERKPYALRAGAIDLVTFLQIGVGFVAAIAVRPILAKYFEGLFKAEQLKKTGEKHREMIDEWLSQVRLDMDKLLRPAKNYIQTGFPHFTFQNKEEALALVIYIGDRVLYVVLNHAGMSASLLARLPTGIIQMLRYVAEKQLPEDGKVLQLYFNDTKQDWKYLLMPTYNGFGHWIDRYIDLETGEIVLIQSQADFHARFCPDPQDEFKFLVSPFRGEG